MSPHKMQQIQYSKIGYRGPALLSLALLAACQPLVGRPLTPAAAYGAADTASTSADAALNTLASASTGATTGAVLPTAAGGGMVMPMTPQAGYFTYPAAALGTLESAQQAQQQRLERIEQALLRLDKRMQLVERNELGRMGSANGLGLPETAAADVFGQAPNVAAVAPLAQTVRQALRTEENRVADPASMMGSAASAPENTPYATGFAPVSQVDNAIRSPLQAAPMRLPSLADPASATGRVPQSAGKMGIWTVRYEPGKVWPDRDQLAASRAIIDLLRNSQTVTLVARGPNPSQPEFQERVRALSRYLAKVAVLETVPISALATPQLDRDTIEVLATP